jgi:hypothetical protein
MRKSYKKSVTKANIILFGTSNSGKTTTLKILHYLLVGSMPPAKTPRVQITYKGLAIDIAFNGDDLETVEQNVAFFKANPYDIALSPTRTDGGPVLAMNYFVNKTFPSTEIVLWKRLEAIPEGQQAANVMVHDPKDYAKNYPKSYEVAMKLKEIIDDIAR